MEDKNVSDIMNKTLETNTKRDIPFHYIYSDRNTVPSSLQQPKNSIPVDNESIFCKQWSFGVVVSLIIIILILIIVIIWLLFGSNKKKESNTQLPTNSFFKKNKDLLQDNTHHMTQAHAAQHMAQVHAAQLHAAQVHAEQVHAEQVHAAQQNNVPAEENTIEEIMEDDLDENITV